MTTDVVIGKYAIESLTTGMYTDPFVMYREYIQNAADSLDDAMQCSLLQEGQAAIRIRINPARRQITIEDNGTGIPYEKAYRYLSDIGNSRKTQGEKRGFRGIGRFSGISYCERLTFSTTSYGEAYSYNISYDASKLRKLISENSEIATAGEALAQVISEKRAECKDSTHYFRVTLEGVRVDTGLLDIEKVTRYLKETAPVRFSRSFSWGQVVSETLKKEIGPVKEYKLTLETPDGMVEIEKPYTDTVLLNRQTNATDTIKDIVFTPIFNQKQEKIGCVWYGVSSFIGTIIDRDVRCMRLRVGNILVGDSTALNSVFKDTRFNGWVIGEVILDSPEFILNARRDDFEHNDAYFVLFEQLKSIASNITKSIRTASVIRNKDQEGMIGIAASVAAEANTLLEAEHIEIAQKENLKARVVAARQQLLKPKRQEDNSESRQQMIEQLDLLIGRLQGSSSYKAINLLPHLTNRDRQLLDRMFTKIYFQNGETEGERIVEVILKALST